jgi:hypothetical protein
VLTKATRDDVAAQGGGPLWSREDGSDTHILHVDPQARGTPATAGLRSRGIGPRYKSEARFAALDPSGAIGNEGPGASGKGVTVERRNARAQPCDMGIELDRSSGDHEHGLEDAPARIGMGEC